MIALLLILTVLALALMFVRGPDRPSEYFQALAWRMDVDDRLRRDRASYAACIRLLAASNRGACRLPRSEVMAQLNRVRSRIARLERSQ